MSDLRYTAAESSRFPDPLAESPTYERHMGGKKVLDLGCYDETALIKREPGT